jgi:hypothetical protein
MTLHFFYVTGGNIYGETNEWRKIKSDHADGFL